MVWGDRHDDTPELSAITTTIPTIGHETDINRLKLQDADYGDVLSFYCRLEDIVDDHNSNNNIDDNSNIDIREKRNEHENNKKKTRLVLCHER